ncbi:AlpA family phage regulatory protein [Pseudomonas lalucatii]|nr:AlpA family phage regulatory protein [Pseudomonas lalucatii]
MAIGTRHLEPIFLRLPDVIEVTRLSRSQIYRMIASGEFPAPIRISKKTAAWPAEAVKTWAAAKISEAATYTSCERAT